MKGDDKIMKYALVIVEASFSNEEIQSLLSYARSVEQLLPRITGVAMLNAGVYLCTLEHGLSGLFLILNQAYERNIPVRVLFSEKEFQFVSLKHS